MASYLRVSHNGVTKTVALYDGIDQAELSSLFSTVFGVTGKIVGVMGEKGLVVPLSLVCKAPNVAPNSVCKLLVVEEKGSAAQQPLASPSLPQGTSVTSDGAIATEDPSQLVSEEDSVEYVTQEIARFLNALRSNNFLTPSQHRRLLHLLEENSNLLFAAYSVAISASDSEYFAEICKDIANSLESEQGRIACEAQDEVLQICDQLYINDKISENQLLYLRHLVLIREEAVASLYDEFQEHQSVPLLAKSLYELANTHPFQSASADETNQATQGEGLSRDEDDEEEEEEGEGEEQEEEEPLPSPEVPKRKTASLMSRGLTGVVALMSRAGVVTKTEAAILHEMIEAENDYVLAAYQVYEKDRNLEDLQDTLVRCVKLEIRKRVTEIQEKELEQLQKERERDRDRQEREEEEDQGASNVTVDGDDVPSSEEEGEEDEEEEGDFDEEEIDELMKHGDGDDANYDDDEENEMKIEDISLPTILQSLQVDNLWEKSVPEEFIKTVFIAVIRNQLNLGQAKTLCDLFHARYDLVHAAWEVYTVQRDLTDFLDTVKRIVRDISAEDIKEQVTKEMKYPSHTSSNTTSTTSNTSSAPPAKPAKPAATASKKPENESPVVPSSSDAQQQSLQDRKAEAMMAVNVAKRELLKHSLEMMVKQKMVTAERAADLYARYLSGDILTDAAIEAYAADRDVGEFLDTLTVLANNSKEELEILMRSVNSDDNNEESATSPAAASAPKKTNDEVALEEIALTQISEIVSEMLKSDMIGPGIAEEFRKLIRARDQRLIDAYLTYQQNKSGAELVNTLLKIVIAAVEGAPKANAAAASSQETKKETAASAQEKKKETATPSSSSSQSQAQKNAEESEETEESALDPSDQKTVVEILMRAKAIDNAQYAALIHLIDSGSRDIARIFASYEENKDVYALIDALKAVDFSKGSSGAAATNSKQEATKKSQQEAEENEEDEEEYEEDFDEDDGIVIEEKFMKIIQNMQLSDLETAALRLAIAENDPAIRTAIDRFRGDLNEANLMKAMKEAARQVITRTLSSRMGVAFQRGGEDFDNEDEEDALKQQATEANQKGGSPSQQNKSPSKAAMNYDEEFDEIEDLEEEDDDEEIDTDSQEEEEDDEEEEDIRKSNAAAGNSLLTSQTARDHIFPILIQELMKENIISRNDGKTILQLFASNSPVISAALDLYDQDGDMGALVESLQQLVETSNKK